MKNVAKFEVIGRVAKVKPGKAMRVSIASNLRMKTEDGWTDDTHWNEVTIFHRPTQDYIAKHIAKGDLVRVTGRLRQGKYERNDGSTVYTVDLIATEFDRLARGADRVQEREAA